jgi:hypothetical protein
LENLNMSAAEALRAARAAGVTVMPDGENLVLEAKAEPPRTVLDALAQHKRAIVALLRSGQQGWTAEDWQARFDERAGFLEYDGGLLRVEAEVQAFERCTIEWLNQHPAPSAPGRCAWCGRPESPAAVVVPFGTGTHTWLHAECWPAWHQSRRADATAALRTMGIAPGGSGDHDD